MPIVFVHQTNAWGCHNFERGQRGSVWTFTPSHRKNFPEGPFHLFCTGNPVKNWEEAKICEYRGIYIAHRLDVSLPARAWRQLPAPVRPSSRRCIVHTLICHLIAVNLQVRKAAGKIHYDCYPPSERPEKVEDEVAKFEQGIHHAQLVVLEFIKLGSKAFSDKLTSEYNQTLRPLGKTSSRLRE